MTLEKIRAEGFDSILAPRDSKSTGGVLYDEFVIYDPDQAIPRYIIHYRTGKNSLAAVINVKQLIQQQPQVWMRSLRLLK